MPDILTPSPEDNEQSTEVRDVTLLGRGRTGKWLENFWYHYKFQTIAAVFLLVALAICIGSCTAAGCFTHASDTPLNVCYAGPLDFGMSMSGDTPTRIVLRDALAPTAARLLEEEDASRAADCVRVYGYTINDSSEFSTVLEQSRLNKENLRDELNTANGYIFLLSENLYRSHAFSPADKVPYMVSVAPYLPDDASAYRLTDDGYAVYLKSTPLADADGFRDLPDDTLLCLRTSFSIFKSNSKKQAAVYARYEALFRAMLDGSCLQV